MPCLWQNLPLSSTVFLRHDLDELHYVYVCGECYSQQEQGAYYKQGIRQVCQTLVPSHFIEQLYFVLLPDCANTSASFFHYFNGFIISSHVNKRSQIYQQLGFPKIWNRNQNYQKVDAKSSDERKS